MTPLPLHLRPASSAATRGEAAGAVLVPGGDPALWLAEAAAWPAAAATGARVFVLPVSATDLRPAGALLIPGGGQRVKDSARALPCRLAQPNVWLPHGADLLPAITAKEAERLFLYHTHLVHPALGLISWDDLDALEPRQLLRLPPGRRGASWEMAVAGPEPAPRLKMVRLELDQGDLAFLQQAGEGIGDKSLQDFKSTRSWGDKLRDSLGGVSAVGFGILGMGASAVWSIANALRPGGGNAGVSRGAMKPGSNTGAGAGAGAAGRPGFLNFLKNWALQQTAALAERRHKELERLMKLLESNPLEGLRYALPLAGGDGAARGYAASPGDRLTLRNPTLGNMGGGGLTDPWNLDNNWRWKLQQRYRQLAAEEANNGHHDRAAYIYGQLLGEWRLAAQTLAQGHHYREAARLYLIKSNSKLEAADCLERGGLLAEAAELFAELKMHERCGDLWQRLGRKSEAFRWYHLALEAAPNRLTGARILEHKMRLDGWAASVLASGWPGTGEALRCLSEHFTLLVCCQAEEEILVQCEHLARHAPQFLSSCENIRAVARIAAHMPYPRARERLTLIGRLAIASMVRAASGDKAARPFLEVLPEFEPEDRLLKTDVRRYTTRKVDPVPMPLRKPQRPEVVLKPCKVFHLPSGATWLALDSHRPTWLALGCLSNGTHTLYTGDLEGMYVPRPFVCPPQVPRAASTTPLRFACLMPVPTNSERHPGLEDQVWLFADPAPAGGHVQIQRPGGDLKVRFFPVPDTYAIAFSGGSTYTAVCRNEEEGLLHLATYHFGEGLLRSRPLGWAVLPPGTTRVPFDCTPERAFLALGSQVYMLENAGEGDPELSGISLQGPVTALAATRVRHRNRVAAAYGSTVVLLTPSKSGWDRVQLHVAASENPALHFLPDGNLIIASTKDARVINVAEGVENVCTLHYSRNAHGSPPVAITSLGPSTCAILLGDGRVEIFKVEG